MTATIKEEELLRKTLVAQTFQVQSFFTYLTVVSENVSHLSPLSLPAVVQPRFLPTFSKTVFIYGKFLAHHA